jgi:hypothetical protein
MTLHRKFVPRKFVVEVPGVTSPPETDRDYVAVFGYELVVVLESEHLVSDAEQAE